MVGAEQGADAVLLAGPGQRHPVLPGDVLLTLNHQRQLHPGPLSGGAGGYLVGQIA